MAKYISQYHAHNLVPINRTDWSVTVVIGASRGLEPNLYKIHHSFQ